MEPVTYAFEYIIGDLPKLRPELLSRLRVIGTVTATDEDRAYLKVTAAALVADHALPTALRLVVVPD